MTSKKYILEEIFFVVHFSSHPVFKRLLALLLTYILSTHNITGKKFSMRMSLANNTYSTDSTIMKRRSLVVKVYHLLKPS